MTHVLAFLMHTERAKKKIIRKEKMFFKSIDGKKREREKQEEIASTSSASVGRETPLIA